MTRAEDLCWYGCFGEEMFVRQVGCRRESERQVQGLGGSSESCRAVETRNKRSGA